MSKKTVETTASGLAQFTGMKNLSPLDTEEVTEIGQYFNKSSGGGEGFEPTEAQLEAMNSGITAKKVTTYDTLPNEDDVKDIISDHFVAGTNVTITDNADGTQTIASTASGGTSDYSDLDNKPSINNVTLSGNKTTADLGIDEVPDITSSDNNKVLTATYSGGTGSYAWGTIPSELPPYTTSIADLGKVLTIDLSTASGLGWAKPLPTYTPSDQGKVLTVTLDQTMAPSLSWEASSTPTPPTAYTETLTGRSWSSGSDSYESVISDGGFVVVNNICTFNIYVTFTLTGTTLVSIPGDKKIIYGFPKPCSTGPVPKFMCIDNQTTPVTLQCSIDTNGDLVVDWAISNMRRSGFNLTGSYLVDPTWTPT